MTDAPLIDVVLLTMLAITGVLIARQRSLLAAAMLTAIYSLLSAGWMLFLDAPDVAFTEAAVGAGVSTILVLATLAATTSEEKDTGPDSPLSLVAVIATGAALVYATFDMPRFGDPASPANRSPLTAAFLHSSQHPSAEHPPREQERRANPRLDDLSDLEPYAVGIPNTVTTVLASFRGFDTMGETAVIFTAGMGVVTILSGARRRRHRPSPVDLSPRDEGRRP